MQHVCQAPRLWAAAVLQRASSRSRPPQPLSRPLQCQESSMMCGTRKAEAVSATRAPGVKGGTTPRRFHFRANRSPWPTLRARPSPAKRQPSSRSLPLPLLPSFLSPLLAMAVRSEAHATRATTDWMPTEHRRRRRRPSPPRARRRSRSVPKPKHSAKLPSLPTSRCVRPRGRRQHAKSR